jgi:hypothetical protein
MIRRPLAATLLVAAALLPLAARADAPQQNSNQAWLSADQCAKEAFRQFPDFTAQSNKKREALRLECLRNHRLPTPAAAGNGG